MAKNKVVVKEPPQEDTDTDSSVYRVMDLLGATQLLEDNAKEFRLAGAHLDADVRRSTVASTGLLMSDILLGGGIFPGGWYTFYGMEGSAKSTHMMSIMTALLKSRVPIVRFFDAEGSSSADYIETIATTLDPSSDGNIRDIFGVKDPATEEWVVEPRIWYAPENSLEAVWQSAASVMRSLPDKFYDKKRWWLQFENTKDNISYFAGDSSRDKKAEKKLGGIIVPSLDEGTPQALFMVDSYPSMVPDSLNTDDGDASIALQARGHAKYGPLVKGLLQRKHCTVLGTNQMRSNIDFSNPYAPKESQPGGNFLKHAADVRIAQRPRAIQRTGAYAVPGPWDTDGPLLTEKSVDYKGGTDSYRFIRMQAEKNKYGTPNLDAWYRIWVSDAMGQGHGFCPVYDTWQYLYLTGQAEIVGRGNKKGLSIILGDESLPRMTWVEFKKMILLSGGELQKAGKKIGFESDPQIRETCFAQIRDGQGIKWYWDNLRSAWEDE